MAVGACYPVPPPSGEAPKTGFASASFTCAPSGPPPSGEPPKASYVNANFFDGPKIYPYATHTTTITKEDRIKETVHKIWENDSRIDSQERVVRHEQDVLDHLKITRMLDVEKLIKILRGP